VKVGVLEEQVLLHPLHDTARNLGSAGPIEEYRLVAIDLKVQGGELLAAEREVIGFSGHHTHLPICDRPLVVACLVVSYGFFVSEFVVERGVPSFSTAQGIYICRYLNVLIWYSKRM